MKRATHVVVLCILVFTLAAIAVGQAVDDAAGAATMNPGYAQRAAVSVASLPATFSLNSLTLDGVTGAAITGASGTASITADTNAAAQVGNDDHFNTENSLPNRSNMDGLNSLATFSGAFITQAGPSASVGFRFVMIGNDPRLGRTTVFPAQIAEVSLQLLNEDGTTFAMVPFAPFEKLTLESPNFEPLNYRSGAGIEYADAIHRAEFFNVMKKNWHTLLIPHVVNKVTIAVPRFVNVQLSNGTVVRARTYFTSTASDGSTVVRMLDLLFNFFFDNEVVNEINLGNFTTNALNTTMFPNTYLFSLNVADPNTPGSCCVLGFHTYFFETGVFPEPRWVTQYVSWISPGIFRGGFQDVTALSHETTEAFADPFGNPTASWQFPGVPANVKMCQANLEEGDPIEVLANATAPTEVNDGAFHFIYHPQNMALYEWFEMGITSNAIDGAFSFPDETVLPHSALPCPQ